MSLFNTLIPSRAHTPVHRCGAPRADLGPTIKPAYEIKETDEAFGLTVHLPGVTKDSLELTAEQDKIQITGRRTWKQPESWTALYRESADVPFELVLDYENAGDVEKIHAELHDGILHISLPKHEAIKPRKITVN